MRLTLENGDWVDLVDRLNYAQARRINEASGGDRAGTLVAAMVTAWALRDVEDQPIEFPARDASGIPLDAVDKIPFDVFQQIGVAAAGLLPGQPDPKATAATSRGSQRANGSTHTQTLPTPTSSPPIQDGVGTTSSPHRPT